MPGLPANYRFSSFVLKGEQPKPKPKYETRAEAHGVEGWDANAVIKVKRDCLETRPLRIGHCVSGHTLRVWNSIVNERMQLAPA